MAFGSLIQFHETDTEANAFSSNVAAGSLLLSLFRTGTTTTITSATDTRGNTWRVVNSVVANGVKIWMYYAISGSAGANTVTIDTDASVVNHFVVEYEGPFASGVESTSNGAATSSNLTTNNMTASRAASALFVGWFVAAGGGPITLSGTADHTDLDTGAYTGFAHTVTTGTGAMTGTVSGATNWWAVGGVFNQQAIIRPDAGSYTLSGTATPLIYDRVFPMDAGAYVVTGDSVALQLGARRNPSMYVTGIAPAYAIDLEVTSQQ